MQAKPSDASLITCKISVISMSGLDAVFALNVSLFFFSYNGVQNLKIKGRTFNTDFHILRILYPYNNNNSPD